MSYSTAVELENVWKRFGAIEAVRGVSLRVPAGCIYGFLGPNGAGKTTIIRMIMSIFFADEGRIGVLDGQDAVAVKDRLGYLPEEKGLYKKMKVAELMAYFARLKGLGDRAAQARADETLPPSKVARRFVLVEGLYMNSGDVAPLTAILELRKKYGFYLIVDDSLGFGSLGATGRGAPELCGVPPHEIDLYVGSLEHSLGSVGRGALPGGVLPGGTLRLMRPTEHAEAPERPNEVVRARLHGVQLVIPVPGQPRWTNLTSVMFVEAGGQLPPKVVDAASADDAVPEDAFALANTASARRVCARMIILSSISVTFITNRTSYPKYSDMTLRKTSKLT